MEKSASTWSLHCFIFAGEMSFAPDCCSPGTRAIAVAEALPGSDIPTLHTIANDESDDERTVGGHGHEGAEGIDATTGSSGVVEGGEGLSDASLKVAMVFAVNIPPHEPGQGVACFSMSVSSSISISPPATTHHPIHTHPTHPGESTELRGGGRSLSRSRKLCSFVRCL